MGSTGTKVTQDTFREPMGEQDSYWDTFALWVINTNVTKVSGRDHRGEFRIGARGQVKLQCTMGEVKCLQV